MFLKRVLRMKTLDIDAILTTKLRRCLTIVDVSLIAVGNVLAPSIYVTAPILAKDIVGPALPLSYLLAGTSFYFTASCYTELGARYPKSGSAYCYTYLAFGELPAFVVGWCDIMAKLLQISSTAKSLSIYLDYLLGDLICDWSVFLFGKMDFPFVSDYVDVVPFLVILVIVTVLCFRVEIMSRFSSALTLVNITAMVILCGAGVCLSDIKNWAGDGVSGFFPYGFSGVVAAASSCLLGYSGFDVISTTAEESKDPTRAIPISSSIAMFVSITTYVAASSVLTLMINYRNISERDGFSEIFGKRHIEWARIVVSVGTFSAMLTSITGNVFALSRIVFSMADDGLMFEKLAILGKNSKSPVISVCIFGAIAAALPAILDMKYSGDLLFSGYLITHIAVSASLMVLRYRPTETATANRDEISSIGECSINVGENELAGQFKKPVDVIIRYFVHQPPSPGRIVTVLVVLMAMSMLALAVFFKFSFDQTHARDTWEMAVLAVLSIAVSVSFFGIFLHTQSTVPLRYKVPLVPAIPSLAILIDIHILVSLHSSTWMPLAAYITLGLCIYFCYGFSHSHLRKNPKTIQSHEIFPT